MSLVSRIRTRRFEDYINMGAKVEITGTISSIITDNVILPVGADRNVVVTGFRLSSDAASPVLVSLGLKPSTGATMEFFKGFIGGFSGSVEKAFGLGDWLFGDLAQHVVMTTTTTDMVAYTVDLRVTSEPAALGYIEHEGSTERGAADHRGAIAKFPPESGLTRGQWDF